MADQEFEARLQRAFADTGGLFAPEDAAAFRRRVEARLDRGWTARRAAVGAAGLAGGTIAVAQLAGAHVFSRLDAASQVTAGAAQDAATRSAGMAAERLSTLTPLLHAAPLGSEALWLIAGMAVLAGALLVSRLADPG